MNNIYSDWLDDNNEKSKRNGILNFVIIICLIISIVLIISLNKKDKYDLAIKNNEIILEKGNHYQIESNDQKLNYKILDLNIARVNDEGNVIGVNEGSTNLIITSNNTNAYKVIKVLVKSIEENEINYEEKNNINQIEEIKEKQNIIETPKEDNKNEIKTETIKEEENENKTQPEKTLIENSSKESQNKEATKKVEIKENIIEIPKENNKREIESIKEEKSENKTQNEKVQEKTIVENSSKESQNKEATKKVEIKENKIVTPKENNKKENIIKEENTKVDSKKVNVSWNNSKEKDVAGGGASRVYSLPNGILVGGSERDDKIYTVFSNNNGKTWSTSKVAASIDGKNLANINFFYNKGKLYMAYRATSGCGSSSTKCNTSLNVSVSYDFGKTWKYHSKIIEHTMSSKKDNRGYWEPYLGMINNKLTVFYANDSASGSWQNIESLTWNGSVWTNKKIISNGKNHGSRDGMPAWIKLSNGTYALVIESSKYRKNGHPFVIQILYSKDGINWSNPKDIYIPKGNGSKAAAPGIAELSNGQLVVSFQTDEDSNKKGDSYSICKTIYSDGTNIESITKNNFSPSKVVFDSTSGMWPAIHYGNGWLYVAGGSKYKKINV